MSQSDPILTMKSQAEWESWLEANAKTSAGVWLRLAKKTSGVASISYAEAVDSALCFGWIDGQKKAQSDRYWLQRFTPRTAKSIWSKINKTRVQSLEAAGRMRPAGLQAIELAKRDGRWERAYASASGSSVPADLQEALDANMRAKAFFATLNSRNRYAILFRIQNVKRAETRARKIAQFIDMLANGETIHP